MINVKVCDFKCCNCDYTTILEENLKIHIAQNHIKAEIIKCDFCPFKHHNETDIQYHKLLKHNWCKYCDKEFGNKLEVTEHLKNHIKEEIIKCDFCPFKHRNQTDLHNHKLSKHNWCKYCDEEFGNKLEVSEHLKEIHGKDDDAEQVKIENEEKQDYENNSNEQVNNVNHILPKRVRGKWIVKLCRLNSNMNLYG